MNRRKRVKAMPEELKPCPFADIVQLVEAVAQTLDERCAAWQETIDRAYKDGKYNQNTGLWEVNEHRVALALCKFEAYRDALNLVDNLGSQIDNLRRSQQPNEPLTVDELPCFEPIYVVPLGSSVGEWSAHWCIYQIDNATAESDTHKGRMWFLYDTDYGKTWLAYRRPPEEGENDENPCSL